MLRLASQLAVVSRVQHFQEELKSHQTAAQFKELKSKQTMGETSVTAAAQQRAQVAPEAPRLPGGDLSGGDEYAVGARVTDPQRGHGTVTGRVPPATLVVDSESESYC